MNWAVPWFCSIGIVCRPVPILFPALVLAGVGGGVVNDYYAQKELDRSPKSLFIPVLFCFKGVRVSHYEIEILVLEDEVRLGQLLCNMIQLHRIGTPHLSTSEIDACQMMEIQRFDLCIFDLSVRGKICHRAVDAANAKSIPTLLLSENNDDSELNLRPARGLRVQKPATEEDIHRAVMELLPPEGGRQGQAI